MKKPARRFYWKQLSPRKLWRDLLTARRDLANFMLFHFPPEPELKPHRLTALPDPDDVFEAIRGTPYADSIVTLAERVMRHDFPIFGDRVYTGFDIDWRRDYHTDRETEPVYFRRIDYLDYAKVGDYRTIWELNRCQQLLPMAQAWGLTGRREYANVVPRQIKSWIEANPFQCGLNWASPREVAVRAIAWIFADHLVGHAFEPAARQRLYRNLYLHGCHLDANLPRLFRSHEDHLGEAVALHALGLVFDQARWRRRGARLAEKCLRRQVLGDGVHFELSSYFHLYALDWLLLHYVLAGKPPVMRPRLEQMADFLDHLMGTSRSMPFLGDDDGGRVFHPYGKRGEFAAATLATCAALFDKPEWLRDSADLREIAFWWAGPKGMQPASVARTSRRFADSGLIILQHRENQLIFDAGPFGPGAAARSHSDALSVILRRGVEDILIDPGTYTSVADPRSRDWFRGSAGHNTIRVDQRDQAVPAGPFGWEKKPDVLVRACKLGDEEDYVDAECRPQAVRGEGTRGVTHRRRVLWRKPDLILIVDELTGSSGGEHSVEQLWHTAENPRELAPGAYELAPGIRLISPESAGGTIEYGWQSPVFGSRWSTRVITFRARAIFPYLLATMIDLNAPPDTSVKFTMQGRRFEYGRFAWDLPT